MYASVGQKGIMHCENHDKTDWSDHDEYAIKSSPVGNKEGVWLMKGKGQRGSVLSPCGDLLQLKENYSCKVLYAEASWPVGVHLWVLRSDSKAEIPRKDCSSHTKMPWSVYICPDLSFSIPLFPAFCLSLPLSLSLSLPLSVPLCLSLSLCPTPYLSLFLSATLSLFVSASLPYGEHSTL